VVVVVEVVGIAGGKLMAAGLCSVCLVDPRRSNATQPQSGAASSLWQPENSEILVARFKSRSREQAQYRFSVQLLNLFLIKLFDQAAAAVLSRFTVPMGNAKRKFVKIYILAM
jgi:hypothetical protein